MLSTIAPILKTMVDDEAPMLKGKFPPCNLRRLELSGNEISDNGIKELYSHWDTIRKSSLNALLIDENKIGNVGATLISNLVLKTNIWRVKNLTLVGNEIDDLGAESLARMMKCKDLMEFDISNNKGITEKGLKYFASGKDEFDIDATDHSERQKALKEQDQGADMQMAIARAVMGKGK
eukprot:TRINITY_DN908_c0_g1_i1.p1 TRINITY_DN908_c0_g1~~TRINITY_DN908_c0_g1_i1.p1  ORF type:complete len:179 (+),score=31.78 TRINITY_DN908_c0_g1_i1:324-860(+)